MVKWNIDMDGNGIEDQIDEILNQNPYARFDIFVNYHETIDDSDLLELERYDLSPSFVSQYINTLIIENADKNIIDCVLKLQDVKCIEIAPTFHPMLDNSARAVRVKESEIYDSTVWKDLGLKGEGVNVAIIDSGVDDVVHTGLRLKFIAGVDTTTAVGVTPRNPDDDVGHGTHCAGIIMGTGSGGENIGIAPEASLVDCRVGDAATLGSATPTNFMEGLEWVRANADRYNISVLSISMGTEHSTNGQDPVSRLANEVVDAGVTVIVAIGNDDLSQNSNIVSSPGSADKVITVGSIHEKNTADRSDDSIAGYSQSGPRPSDGDGDDKDELKPDITAPGSDIRSCAYNTRNAYVAFSGTSMATPHVAGNVALMEQAYPPLEPSHIKEILHLTSEMKGNPYDSNLDEKYNEDYGYGMMDSYGAVRRAVDLSSFKLNMPQFVDSGTRIKVQPSLDLYRGAYFTSRDELSLVLEFPDFFSRPENITLTSSAGGQVELNSLDIERFPGLWRVSAEATLNSPEGEDIEVDPALKLFTTSPQVGDEQTFDFQLSGELNRIPLPTQEETISVGKSEQKPDLVITPEDITFSQSPVNAGETVVIYANISNRGLSDAFDARVDFYDGNPTSGILIGSGEVDVPAGARESTYVEWVATAGTIHNIYVAVDPDDEIDELSENNNSATKPIRVTGGVNAAPVARLASSPESLADIHEEVTFFGDESFDTDGSVTKWRFFFGDGNESGWINVDNVGHSYSIPGNFTASLIVQDNGGRNSTNNASMTISVRELEGGRLGFYILDEGNLTLDKPDISDYSTMPCPDGYTPYPIPSSPIGIVEYRTIGLWEIGYSLETVELVEKMDVEFWIENSLEDRGFDVQFRTTVSIDGTNLFQIESPEDYVEPSSPPMMIQLSSEIPITDLTFRSDIQLTLEIKVNGEGLNLVYGNIRYPSGIISKALPHENQLPEILELNNASGEAEEPVELTVKAVDSDGSVAEYWWDTDNDLDWDYLTQEGSLIHTFNVPDKYIINVGVADNDGGLTEGVLYADIYESGKSLIPLVYIDYPHPNTTLTENTFFFGGALDDNGIKEVRAQVDDQEWIPISDDELWEVEIDISVLGKGKHIFRAMAVDVDDQESEIAEIEFDIDIIINPPQITSISIEPRILEDKGGTVAIDIILNDPDGPDDIASVAVDLSSLGLGSMLCDRTGRWNYALIFNLPGGLTLGNQLITIIAIDRTGAKTLENSSIEIIKTNLAPKIDIRSTIKLVNIDNNNIWECIVKISDPDGWEDLEKITIDLSPMGGPKEKELRDDGKMGDKWEMDGKFTLKYPISDSIENGQYELTITAFDKKGNSAMDNITVRIMSNPKNNAEGESFIVNNPVFIYAGAGIFILLVLIGLIIKKGKK